MVVVEDRSDRVPEIVFPMVLRLLPQAIDDLGPGDEGEYTCTAENPWGDTTCSLVVATTTPATSHPIPPDKPGAPRHQACSTTEDP